MTPESVGVPKTDIVLGKHSGRHALVTRYNELGYDLNPDQLSQIYKAFTDLADRKKKIYDQDLILLVQTAQVAMAA
jgi:2-isopropylmalate synthase